MAGPNWPKIKAEYIKGGISTRKLAEKHKVSYATLRSRAETESWTEQRTQVQRTFSAELPQRVANDLVNEAAEWTRQSLALAAQARELFAQRMVGSKKQTVVGFGPEGPSTVEIPFLNAPRDLKDYITALAAADKMGRLSLGMKDGLQAPSASNPLQDMVDAIQRSKARAAEESSEAE